MARTQVQSELIATNSISGTIIADGAITSTHLAANSVDTAELVTGSIDTIHIAANQVTSAKIASNSILTRHIQNDQIGGDQLTNNIDIAGTLDVTGATTLDSTLGVAGVATITNAANTDGLLVTSPASAGGTGIQLKRLDSNTDQQVGRILFGNNTDTDLVSVSAKTDGANDNGALMFSTQPDSGSLTERMRIDHNGKVGMGATSPSKNLHIKSGVSEDTGIIIENTNNAQNLDIDYWNNAGAVQGRLRYAEGAGSFSFLPNTSATEALTILYDGKVGIGTASPDSPLHINGSANSEQVIITGNGNANRGLSISTAANGAQQDAVVIFNAQDTEHADYPMMTFQTGGTERMRISPGGNVGIGITTPNESGFGATSRVLSIAGTAQDAFGVLELISTDVTSSNRIGEIRFGNLDAGSSFASNTGIRATRDGADNSSALSLWNTNAGTFAERMRIDSNGTVQIGSSSAYAAGAAVLHLHQPDATSNAYLHITQQDGGATSSDGMSIGVLDGGTNASIRLRENGYMNFYTNNTERMRILADGTLCVGADSDVTNTTVGLSVYSSNAGGIGIGHGNGSNEYRRIYYSTGEAGYLYFDAAANTAKLTAAGAWSDASDVSYKENIVDITYGLDAVKAMKPRKYKVKADDSNAIGFIAQEIESIIPEVVSGEDGSKGIAYGQLTAVLVKAIQEQQTIIDDLKSRIKTLEDA